jgi:uncharacterized protein with GYD domain
MAKYLVQATYTAEGLKGLQKDKASGRRQAVSSAVEALGGRVEMMYFALSDFDVLLVFDMPDTVSGAALGLAVSSSGLVRTKTTALLTIEETDTALRKSVSYRPPGG